MAYKHAYSFTHASQQQSPETNIQSFKDKFNLLLNGKPYYKKPSTSFSFPSLEIDTIPTQIPLEIWKLEMIPDEKGTVILFHGYGANKSDLINEAIQYYRMGYTAILVDFRGAGNSGGDVCTIGYKEAEDVMAVFEWIKGLYKPEGKVILHGNSMGAAAIMRAVAELDIQPDALVLECPFGSLRQAVANRFNMLGIPAHPLAECLTYWGGHHHNFIAFDFAPVDYAKKITVPTLLLYGQKDQRVTRGETEEIFENLAGKKEMVLFHHLKHEPYFTNSPDKWFYEVSWFLKEQLEHVHRDTPPYTGKEINPSDLEAPSAIRKY